MTKPVSHRDEIGVVIIGRNEGERLRLCLESVVTTSSKVVYVDSGSTDQSVELAHKLGVEVINLDISVPFTAARARNEGFSYLCKISDNLSFVQFVDGDCEVTNSWLDLAAEYLDQNIDVAVVCGRRRERYPEASIYNKLCDIEWNTPIGEATACGGDALMRVEVLKEVSGFNADVIAGEEPELCVRIRQKGWKIWRLDLEMTLHDANMNHLSQWWKRNLRSGYAFALGAHMHGALPEQHWVNEVKRARLWGGYFPITIVLATIMNEVFLFGLFIYPLQVARIAIKNRKRISINWQYAFFVTLGKFPEMQGQLKFYLNNIFNSRSEIIEYKSNSE